MIENSFFGREGLTITSANHLANISKEMYEAIESRLESIKFYNRDFMLAVNGNTFRVENESDRAELDGYLEGVRKIGVLKSLIAYLREAIKAKAQLETDSAFEKHIDALVSEGREDVRRPEVKPDVTFERELEKLSPEQKARYYTLEARCASLGAFIHPDGAFAKARKAFLEHSKNPTQVNGRGQEAEICTFTSGFSAEEIDGKFFALQKEYRADQAEFNRMKAEIEQRVRDANLANAEDAVTATERWTSARALERQRYDRAVRALKVVIPQNLRDIYDEVNRVACTK